MHDDIVTTYVWLSVDEATVIAGLLWRLARTGDDGAARLAFKYQAVLAARSAPKTRGDLVLDETAPAAERHDGHDPPMDTRLRMLTGRYMKLRRSFDALRAQTAALRADVTVAHTDARSARIEAQRVRQALGHVAELLGTSGPVEIAGDDPRLRQARSALQAQG